MCSETVSIASTTSPSRCACPKSRQMPTPRPLQHVLDEVHERSRPATARSGSAPRRSARRAARRSLPAPRCCAAPPSRLLSPGACCCDRGSPSVHHQDARTATAGRSAARASPRPARARASPRRRWPGSAAAPQRPAAKLSATGACTDAARGPPRASHLLQVGRSTTRCDSRSASAWQTARCRRTRCRRSRAGDRGSAAGRDTDASRFRTSAAAAQACHQC